MNITDVMRLVNWKFEIQEMTHMTNSLVSDNLYAEFNLHSCEVTYLQVELKVFDNLDSVDTYNEIATLIGSENKEELIQVDISDNDLVTIDAAAASKNLTRSQFIMSAIVAKLESIDV